MQKNKKKRVLSAFVIIYIIIILLALTTLLLPEATFNGINQDEIVNGSGIVRAKLSDVLLAPMLGLENSIDVCTFVLVLGGFLAIVQKTGALENGIKALVKKMKGKELILIPILMILFSIGGTTFGMMEEAVGFYPLIAFTMVAAGMDTLVAAATVLLGAGCGVLGSTINPFANGVAISSLPSGINVNQGIIILLGVILWFSSLAISIYFVMKYAKKVKNDKSKTFLSVEEQKRMEEFKDVKEKDTVFTTRQKITLWLFLLSFAVMIVGFIPWNDFGITIFDSFTGWLTGSSLGNWWFYEAAAWFLLMSIIIGIINKFSSNEIIDEIIEGAKNILSVVLIIAVARGASVLMQSTYLDNYIIYNVSNLLRGTKEWIFTPCNYILHIFLSVLVPSSSGLGSISTPIIGGLANELGYSIETTIMTFVAANGLVNLFTPTCGAIMGGLALAKVDYTTWVKWSAKVIAAIAVASLLILTLASILL